MSIADWPESERPREKLLNLGAQSLSDAELLAIFLRTGVVGLSALDLARQMIQQHGSLQALFAADQREFCQQKGLGKAKYVQLQAVLELAKRCFWEDATASAVMQSAQAAKCYVQAKMCGLSREVFACLFLNSQHHVVEYEELFLGTLSKAPVFPREIAKKALHYNAAAVILCHNHPSGVCEPSPADREMTELITEALNLLDIRVLDHFICAKTKVYSFSEHGLL